MCVDKIRGGWYSAGGRYCMYTQPQKAIHMIQKGVCKYLTILNLLIYVYF
jgi:hypothetical protein